MKTTKKLAILSLALIMCLSAFTPSFSWFTHNNGNSGYGIYYNRPSIDVSKTDSVSITTKAYEMNGRKISLDAHRNKEFKDTIPATVAGGSIQYYRTTLTNNSDTTAYVSLFLNGMTNNVNLKIGSDYPIINEQAAGKSERHIVTNPAMRIYFEPRDAKGWDGDSMYLYAKPVGENYPSSGTAMIKADGSANSSATCFTGNNATNKKTFFCDLPADTVTEEFFIANDGTYANCTGFKRTKPFTSYVPQTVYSLTGYSTNDNNLYAACETRVESGAVSVPKKLDYVSAASGGFVYITLPSGHKGCTVDYALENDGDSSYYNLNANGRLRINGQGSGGIETTVTGDALGDTDEFTTEIKFSSTKNNIPICRNIAILPADTNASGETYVEWYIDNGMGTGVSFDTSKLMIVK